MNLKRTLVAVGTSILLLGGAVVPAFANEAPKPPVQACTPGTVTAATVSGKYGINVNYLGVNYAENLVLVQTGSAITGGSVALLDGTSPWTVDSGSVAGSAITFDGFFNSNPGMRIHFTGTVAAAGSLSGNWADLPGSMGRVGTWATTSGHASVTLCAPAKGGDKDADDKKDDKKDDDKGKGDDKSKLRTIVVRTDSSWTVDNTPTAAVPVSAACLPGYGSWGWTAALAPSQWIWTSACTSTDTAAHSFSKTVKVDGKVTAASIQVAIDNMGSVLVNGHDVLDVAMLNSGDMAPFNQVHTVDVTAWLHGGENKITIVEKNLPIGSTSAWGNPAGVVGTLTATIRGDD